MIVGSAGTAVGLPEPVETAAVIASAVYELGTVFALTSTLSTKHLLWLDDHHHFQKMEQFCQGS